MRVASKFLYPAAVALIFGTGLQAQASLVQWSYNWSRSPALLTAGTGKITLTDEPGASAAGPSDIVATNLKTFSSALPTAPDHLAAGAYTLHLTLTDNASHASKIMTFTGTLSGTFSTGSAHVVNAFTGATTLFAVLRGNTYSVSLTAYSPPGPPDASNSGSISAHVDVTPNKTPEPSTIVLGGLGAGFFGLLALVRRRRGRNLALSMA